MTGQIHKELSLKDFDTNAPNSIKNRAEKRKIIEEQNLKASRIILAANTMRNNSADVVHGIQERDKLKAMAASGELDYEAAAIVYDRNIRDLEGKIKQIEAHQSKNHGFISESQQKQLEDFRKALKNSKLEKQEMLAKQESSIKKESIPKES